MRCRGVGRALTTAWVLTLLAAAPMAQNQRDVTYPCDRTCLTRHVDSYIAALLANDPSRLPLSPAARLTLE